MASQKTLLYYGALLHDIGKIIFRGSQHDATHAALGADFITTVVGAINERFAADDGLTIAEQLRYHHIEDLRRATDLKDDSLAFITCFANAVAAGDCLENGGDSEAAGELDRDVDLRRIFNTINGHHEDETIPHTDYRGIASSLRDGLASLDIDEAGIIDLLWLLESVTSAIPASTNAEGLIDVPLFDHLRTTAGIAACVYEYLCEHGESNFRTALLEGERGNQNAENMFLLFSCDMSGIQDFIYNISGEGALKQLRARSLYLELLLEHVMDELLETLGLCRANLLYTGGGHAYLLLPNTEKTQTTLERFNRELRAWFVEHYRTDLFIACAWAECCADDLANRGEDKTRYPMLYQCLSRKLSEVKAARYDADIIRKLNFGEKGGFDHSRECTECHRSDLQLASSNKCSLCDALGRISRSLFTRDVFVVERDGDDAETHSHHPGLALPFGCTLRMYSRESFLRLGALQHRVYAKEGVSLPGHAITHIWLGDYAAEDSGNDISAYAEYGVSLSGGKGIRRLGVLRADVDDLGATFVSGLPRDKVCIARTATLSRAISYFFKHEINDVLNQGSYQVQIIYSGGDDLFLVGNWSDVIYAAMDIRKALDEYTGNGAITMSAGVGMFDSKYPIARMASEAGDLEDAAKRRPAEGTRGPKNAIALWSTQNVFTWDDFINVVEPRKREMQALFENSSKGTSFIYKIITLLRGYDDVASAPRLAYLLARSFEDDHNNGGQASRQLYALAQNPAERRSLLAALEWYACSIREERG